MTSSSDRRAEPSDSGAPARESRLWLAALSCVLVALPFLAVRFPPITDLPQHVAQIRLFLEAMREPSSHYMVQWYTPYSLAYAVIGAAWALVSPEKVGRVAVLALAVLWTLGTHTLAARRGRSGAAAVLASTLVFNLVLYWGFLSFAFGWIAFVPWFLLASRPAEQPFRWTDAVLYLFGAILLYVSHVLWLVFGLCWLALACLVHRVPARIAALRLASVSPVIAAVAVWYPSLAAAGFVSPTEWFVPVLERLSFSWFVDAALGGIQGTTESLVVGFLLGWVGLSLLQNRKALRASVDADLALLAAVLLTMGFLLPDEHMNTISFGVRWIPPGVIALVLAVPAPRLLERQQRAVALAMLAVFCLATAGAWKRFERDELSGLDESLAQLPQEPHVLGLDFIKKSATIKWRPFLQTFAYAQVEHGGTLNFSFAGFAPSLVVYRERRVGVPWTVGLEWYAERVRLEDFRHFDYVIVNAPERAHRAFSRDAPVEPVTTAGRLRLYRSKRIAADAPDAPPDSGADRS
jgi:hypothetical protein